MDITKELAEARTRSQNLTNLINEMGQERLILLETLNRIHQLGKDRQNLLNEFVQVNNRIQELASKPQANDGQPRPD